jgi:hypothetical protein
MVYFNLNLTSGESTFEYSFSQEFLDNKYEIALIKLDGILEINKKININHTNNKFYYWVGRKVLSARKILTRNFLPDQMI